MAARRARPRRIPARCARERHHGRDLEVRARLLAGTVRDRRPAAGAVRRRSIGAAYEALAADYRRRGQAPLRTAVWRQASEAALHRLCRERGIDEQRRMFVLPGIESVQAVMDSIRGARRRSLTSPTSRARAKSRRTASSRPARGSARCSRATTATWPAAGSRITVPERLSAAGWWRRPGTSAPAPSAPRASESCGLAVATECAASPASRGAGHPSKSRDGGRPARGLPAPSSPASPQWLASLLRKAPRAAPGRPHPPRSESTMRDLRVRRPRRGLDGLDILAADEVGHHQQNRQCQS